MEFFLVTYNTCLPQCQISPLRTYVCMYVCMYVCNTSCSADTIQQGIISDGLCSNPNLYSEIFRLRILVHKRDIPSQLSRDFSLFLQGNDGMAN
jgi:hypothetical protein